MYKPSNLNTRDSNYIDLEDSHDWVRHIENLLLEGDQDNNRVQQISEGGILPALETFFCVFEVTALVTELNFHLSSISE